MKIPFFHRRGQVESRSYTDDLVAQAFANSTEPQSAPGALAVVESCISLIASPLMVASVSGYAISGADLVAMGRDVLLRGNSVWLIEVLPTGQVQLLRASAFEVAGRTADPTRWSYSLELETPGGQTIKRTAPANGVIHIMADTPPGRSWQGNPPWASAGLTASAMAEIERGVRDESRILNGRVWVAPDGSSQDQHTGMARALRGLKGGKMIIAETVAKGFGQGALAAPRADWVPVKVGQEHSVGNVGMRQQLEASLASAYGVSPLWFNPSATAPGVRECKRLAFLNCTLPLSKAIADELTAKMETLVAIRYPNLSDQSVDVHLRARGAAALGQLGVPPQDALVIAGLGEVLITNEDADNRKHLPSIPPQIPPQIPTHIYDAEGRATGLVLSHLRDGKVIKDHPADSPCDLCESRTNGRMEHRNS